MRGAVEVTSSAGRQSTGACLRRGLFRTGIPLPDTRPIRVVRSGAGDEFGSATAANRLQAIGVDGGYR